MIEFALIFIVSLAILFLPAVIPYLALLYLFAQGLAAAFIFNLKFVLAGITVYPLDLVYAIAAIYALIYFIKNITNSQFKTTNLLATRHTVWLILLYMLYFIVKALNGYFAGVPLDTVLRFTMVNTQVVYFFLPLVIYKDFKQLKKLLLFTIVLSVIFSLGQPFLMASEATLRIIKGQGTFRLGYGDASILLALGVIAFYSWERKRYLAILPLAGILMLAHRSAFLGIALALMAQAYLRGKSIKTFLLMGIAGAVIVTLMAIISSVTHIDVLGKTLNRVGETFEATGTSAARAGTIIIAFEEFLKRPLSGFTYKEAYDLRSIQDHNVRAFDIMTPHNFALNSIMQHGLIGTFILLMLMYRSLRWAYKLSQIKHLNSQGAYLFGSMLFFIIFALMNNTLEGVGYVFWFLSGTTFWFINHQLTLSEK